MAKPHVRQKRLQGLITVPPRNALVPLVRARKSGAHGKSGKALRRADRMALRRGDHG